ncbi:uncharacterized protein LOC143826153 isoform X2 [Paroedura picta]|uniref:uncharacterized protein LOC143826153 isoform X2 n=1 Tax=Paroedura picta TaxID=143630 RepID=UPI0040575D27
MFKDSSTKRNSTKQPFGKEKTNATDKPFGKEKTYATEKEKTNATEKMGWILAGRHYVKLRMLAEYKKDTSPADCRKWYTCGMFTRNLLMILLSFPLPSKS